MKERKTKAEIFVEIFLWNKNVDSLVRVLQRMEALGIWSKQEMRSFEVRLEELRSSLNADFALTILRREHADHWRLREERRELELLNRHVNHSEETQQ